MSLNQKILDALKQSMLARDAARTGTLRLVKSALGYAQIEAGRDVLEDAEILAVLRKEAKKRRDALAEYERAGRAAQADQERGELAVIEEFLPTPLSAAEMEELVRACIAESGAASKKDTGAVMKLATARADGRADGRTLSGLVARLLP
jgi:uncharacterized protein YqeY